MQAPPPIGCSTVELEGMRELAILHSTPPAPYPGVQLGVGGAPGAWRLVA